MLRIKALFYAFMRWFRYAKKDCIFIWKTSKVTRNADRWVRNNVPGGWCLILVLLLSIIAFIIIDSVGILGLLKILVINTIIVAILMALVIFIPHIIEECS